LPQTTTLLKDRYQRLLSGRSSWQWQRIGTQRRAGVAVPLFSVFSEASCGIGELPDLNLLVDWCGNTGISLIQLLPLNDVGFGFRPYDAHSMFALDPMYLCLRRLKGVGAGRWDTAIDLLKEGFPTGRGRVDYRIKGAKLELLWRVFEAAVPGDPPAELTDFVRRNTYWIEDYALFRAIKERQQERAWWEWPAELKDRQSDACAAFGRSNGRTLLFQKWLQWQLFEQFRETKVYAGQKGVLFMGDLPFLVSRDSADVWAHQDYFKLDLASGAPPDMLYSKGQRWGMPPYNWANIAAHGYDYVIEKLGYAENFYDLYRIEHVVGMFRVWTIPVSEPEETAGVNGAFDPADENEWETHGRRLLDVLLDNTGMLACAEDLGTVPECAFRVLDEYGIPGIDVQRWTRAWGKSYDFSNPEAYRAVALATLGTHDTSGLLGWWQYEAGTVDKGLFERACQNHGVAFDAVAAQLFELEQTRHNRLRWCAPHIDETRFLRIIGKEEKDAWGLLDLFRGSVSEREQFLKFLGCPPGTALANPHVFMKKAVERVSATACIFTSLLFQDWLALDTFFDLDPWEARINFPGTVDDRNWTLAIPQALDDILDMPVNLVIRKILSRHERLIKQ